MGNSESAPKEGEAVKEDGVSPATTTSPSPAHSAAGNDTSAAGGRGGGGGAAGVGEDSGKMKLKPVPSGTAAQWSQREPSSSADRLKELNELRAVFNSVTSRSSTSATGAPLLEFNDLLCCEEVKAEIDAGDLQVSDLEALWLQVAAMPDATETKIDTAPPLLSPPPPPSQRGGGGGGGVGMVTITNNNEKSKQPWGVYTALTFRGFLYFLKLAEEDGEEGSVPSAYLAVSRAGIANSYGSSCGGGGGGGGGGNDDSAVQERAVQLIYARKKLMQLIRATLVVHYRGLSHWGDDGGGGDGQAAVRGVALAHAMIKAAVESGLSRRGTKEELLQRGVMQASSVDPRMEHNMAHVRVARLLSNNNRPTMEDLQNRNIIMKGRGANSNNLEMELRKNLVKHQLQVRESVEGLRANGILQQPITAGINSKDVERSFLQAKLSHDLKSREERDELVAQGILLDATPQQQQMGHALAGVRVARCLQKRPSLEEIKAAGVYLTPVEEKALQLEHAMVRDGLKKGLGHSRRASKEELVEKGILVEETPVERSRNKEAKARVIQDELTRRSSLKELKQSGIYLSDSKKQAEAEHLLAARCLKYGLEGRPTMEELRDMGIHVSELEERGRVLQMQLTKDSLKSSLENRVTVEELERQGIYRAQSSQEAAEQKNILSKELRMKLQRRPSVEEMAMKGFLDSDVLHFAYDSLMDEATAAAAVTLPPTSSSPGITLAQLLEWLPLMSAIEAGVTTKQIIEREFIDVAVEVEVAAGGASLSSNTTNVRALTTYEQFDTFLQRFPELPGVTSPTSKKRYTGGLKTFFLQHLQEKWEKQLQHEAMKRRNDVIATLLEEELSHRIGLSELLQKGIYIKLSPMEKGVERAHIIHALAHHLAHRPDLETLENKGLYLKDALPMNERRQERRNVRNLLEAALARRPALETLEEEGYLEMDDLMTVFTNLSNGANKIQSSQLKTWGEVRHMIEAGDITEVEVDESLNLLSSKGGTVRIHNRTVSEGSPSATLSQGGGDNSGWIDFNGFVKFAERLNLKVVGLISLEDLPDDSEQLKEQKKRLRAKRERILSSSLLEVGDIRDRLELKLQQRPDRRDPNMLRVAKEFNSTRAVELERQLVSVHLNHLLEQRANIDAEQLQAHGIMDAEGAGGGGCIRGGVKSELEYKVNRQRLGEKMMSRPDAQQLENKGIIHTQTAAQETMQRMIARDSLKHHLQGRPDLVELRQRGIYRGTSKNVEAVTLEHRLNGIELAKALQRRPSLQELMEKNVLSGYNHYSHDENYDDIHTDGSSSGSGSGSTVSAMHSEVLAQAIARKDLAGPMGEEELSKLLVNQLSLADASRAIDATLEGLSMHNKEERDRLAKVGILKDKTNHELDMQLRAIAVKDGLERRGSKSELLAKGILLPVTMDGSLAPVGKQLERQLVSETIKHKLDSERRPSVTDLKLRGIMLNVTAQAKDVERFVCARQLIKTLNTRDSIDTLKAQGIYQNAQVGGHSLHDKLLRKALLSKHLSQQLLNGNGDELSRLKQKGVYKDTQQWQLKAERAVITSQLAKLLKLRPTEQDLMQQRPQLQEASELAVVFEQLSNENNNQPSAATTSGESAGDNDDENTANFNPDELIGGRVCFAVIKRWPAIIDHLAAATGGGGGDDASCDATSCRPTAQEMQLLKFFDLVDLDGDGIINFSEFLRFVELCDLNPEDHIELGEDELKVIFLKLTAAEEAHKMEDWVKAEMDLSGAAEAAADADLSTGTVSLETAMGHCLLSRWASNASVSHKDQCALWSSQSGVTNATATTTSTVSASNSINCAGFVSFALKLQQLSKDAHAARLDSLREQANQEAAAKADSLKARLVKALQQRSDYAKLQARGIVKAGLVAPAAAALEKNLIANFLKEQIANRPAMEELQGRGVLLPENTRELHDDAAKKLVDALSLRHDDGPWRSNPTVLSGGHHKREMSSKLENSLRRRLSLRELEQSGIILNQAGGGGGEGGGSGRGAGGGGGLGGLGSEYALLLDCTLSAFIQFKATAAELLIEEKGGCE